MQIIRLPSGTAAEPTLNDLYRSIDPHRRGEREQWAAKALEYLLLARTAAKNAGSRRAIVRIDEAISSARGAVRAAGYRDRRAG